MKEYVIQNPNGNFDPIYELGVIGVDLSGGHHIVPTVGSVKDCFVKKVLREVKIPTHFCR